MNMDRREFAVALAPLSAVAAAINLKKHVNLTVECDMQGWCLIVNITSDDGRTCTGHIGELELQPSSSPTEMVLQLHPAAGAMESLVDQVKAAYLMDRSEVA